jgi:ribosomal protein S12 methylthiotransferase
VIRSTFIVGFPGETEEDFQYLLDWLTEAQLDRVGCFQYSPVEGAPANDLGLDEAGRRQAGALGPLHGPPAGHQHRPPATAHRQEIEVLIDEVEEQGSVGRSFFDAPEIDGSVFIDGDHGFKPGDKVRCRIVDADEYDMWAEPV